jgi:1,4-dihydroxy-2-naphthoyl-CoA synthase
VTLNPGKIEGGGALNVVPDLAIMRRDALFAATDDYRARDAPGY